MQQAHKAVAKAIKDGLLPLVTSLSCDDCGKQAVNYHHESYEPEYHLDVEALCRSCHTKRHPRGSSPNEYETTIYHLAISNNMLERFKAKQPYISLPDKLRRLIERYVNNEVELEDD